MQRDIGREEFKRRISRKGTAGTVRLEGEREREAEGREERPKHWDPCGIVCIRIHPSRALLYIFFLVILTTYIWEGERVMSTVSGALGSCVDLVR